jgi:hypothetical protein
MYANNHEITGRKMRAYPIIIIVLMLHNDNYKML